MTVPYILAAVVAYLLGGVPCATLVARRHGVALSRVGDGNPGAWNVLQALGWRRAWPAFLGDGGKALAAVAAGLALAAVWAAASLLLCVDVTHARGSAWGARAGVFAVPRRPGGHRPDPARRRNRSSHDAHRSGVSPPTPYSRPRQRRGGRSTESVRRAAATGSASGDSQ